MAREGLKASQGIAKAPDAADTAQSFGESPKDVGPSAALHALPVGGLNTGDTSADEEPVAKDDGVGSAPSDETDKHTLADSEA